MLPLGLLLDPDMGEVYPELEVLVQASEVEVFDPDMGEEEPFVVEPVVGEAYFLDPVVAASEGAESGPVLLLVEEFEPAYSELDDFVLAYLYLIGLLQIEAEHCTGSDPYPVYFLFLCHPQHLPKLQVGYLSFPTD